MSLTFSREAKTLIVLLLLLLGFGLAILSSAGIIDAQRRFGSSYYYLISQLQTGVLVGAVLFLIASQISYRFWKKLALPILLGCLLLLLLVFVPGVGYAAKGATRWIHIGNFNFQPSEVLKLGLIIYFAAWFGKQGDNKLKNWAYSTLPFLTVLGFAVLMLGLQPDIGTLGIVICIAIALYFFAGAPVKHLLALLLLLAVCFTFLALLSPYRFNRLLAFARPESDTRGISYHINQSKIAIARGGWFGVGFGQSKQKESFLPEPVGDSVFAVAVEEVGLVGSGFLIALYLALIWKLTAIARQARDKFAALYVLGVAVWIGVQSFINMAAISGLVPLTGIPLPFVSFGGTALAVLLGSLGIVANIANQNA